MFDGEKTMMMQEKRRRGRPRKTESSSRVIMFLDEKTRIARDGHQFIYEEKTNAGKRKEMWHPRKFFTNSHELYKWLIRQVALNPNNPLETLNQKLEEMYARIEKMQCYFADKLQ